MTDKNLFNMSFAGNIRQAQDIKSVLKAAKELKDLKNVKWIFLGDGKALEELKLLLKNMIFLIMFFPRPCPLSDIPVLLNRQMLS